MPKQVGPDFVGSYRSREATQRQLRPDRAGPSRDDHPTSTTFSRPLSRPSKGLTRPLSWLARLKTTHSTGPTCLLPTPN